MKMNSGTHVRLNLSLSLIGILFVYFNIILVIPTAALGADNKIIKIGVLAKRGPVRCLEQWSPTADYLTKALPGKTFKIVPIDFEQITAMVEAGAVDFLLTNSSFYVELEIKYGVNRIATLKNKRLNGSRTTFAGVIFYQKNHPDIQSIHDLKGKSFMAVKATSFGGWRMAWREFKEAGIDPFSDFSALQFGGTHDAVVYAVKDGKVDAGTVRTDTLERMQLEEKINLDDFHIIHEHGDNEDSSFLHSTREYPEWPMVKIKHTSDSLAEKVAVALINMPQDSAAAQVAKCSGWTIPLNYQSVHDCLKFLKVGPYEDLGKITITDVLKKYWPIFLLILILFVVMTISIMVFIRFNRKIQASRVVLKKEITEHQKVDHRLRASEEKLRNIVENSTNLFYSHTVEHEIIYISPQCQEFLQCEPVEAMIRWTEFATDNPINQKGFELTAKTIKTGMRQHPYELELMGKKGKKIFVEVREAPILKNGKTVAIVGSLTDITSRKMVEKEKVKLRSQLQQSQKMESVGTLAGGIAHDFNNILFPIIGHAEMLLEDVPEDSPFRVSLNQIYSSALRASELVRQILTFSRQENTDFKLMKMQSIIKEALKLIRSTIPTTIEIKQNIQTDCGVIKADPTQIHQIIMNLATNAYHAMEETGGELKVGLKQMELGTLDLINQDMAPGVYACLTIADTGKGMDKELTNKIFDPFFTTKGIGKGTGMGLSVVHGIVKSMGGAVRVYSEPGKGSEFQVYFPVEKSSFEKQSPKINEPLPGGTERVLLVDDEEGIITMEKQALERLGYHVTSRTSSIEALDVFKANPHKFDLVITDMAMPNISGDKLSAELIKIRPDIPVLLCTGFSETMSEEKAAFLGIKGFLLKPIVMQDLSQKVREVLGEN